VAGDGLEVGPVVPQPVSYVDQGQLEVGTCLGDEVRERRGVRAAGDGDERAVTDADAGVVERLADRADEHLARAARWEGTWWEGHGVRRR
jgi:hypothetical protein